MVDRKIVFAVISITIILAITVSTGFLINSDSTEKYFKQLKKSEKNYLIKNIEDAFSRIYYTKNGEKFRGVLYHDLKSSLNWIRKNTGKDEVITAWWDYGHSLRGYAEREVIVYTPSKKVWKKTKPPNVGPWKEGLEGEFSSKKRIRDLAEVFTGNTSTASTLMKKYDSEYLLITSHDIPKYTAISMVANEYSTDYNSILSFGSPEKISSNQSSELIKFSRPGSEVRVSINKKGDEVTINSAPVYISDQRRFRIDCGIIDELKTFPSANAYRKYCFSLYPYQDPDKIVSNGEIDPDTKVALIPKEILNSTIVRLYFRKGSNSDKFKKVYSDESAEIWKRKIQ